LGTNKRYAAHYDKLRDQKVVEMIMRDGGTPDTLGEAELELHSEAVVRPSVALKVRAWVRYGTVPVKVEAEAVAWTAFAVAIRWRGPGEEIHKAWVWAAAVR